MKNKSLRILAVSLCLTLGVMCFACAPADNTADDESLGIIPAGSYTVTATKYWTKNEDKNIYGTMYRPDGKEGKLPTIILNHGLFNSSDRFKELATYYCSHGYLCYAFDFCGGADNNRENHQPSDGSKYEMSLKTEISDLNHVIDQIKALDYVDTNNLFLFGQSQGGFIATYVATHRANEIKALGLYFPGYSIGPTRAQYPTNDDIPERITVATHQVGKIYAVDCFYINEVEGGIYSMLGNFKNEVCICHGTADTTVNISQTISALNYFENAKLHPIESAGHGFKGMDAEVARSYIIDLFNRNLIK